MKFLILPGVLICLIGAGGAAVGQGVPPPAAPAPPVFPSLFPNPTNNNGYEELVQATDAVRNSAPVEALLADPRQTLVQKRRLLEDPDVARALVLVRAGLNKPVFSPRRTIDENTALPELGQFRKLARLLCIEQYVQFADGRVDAAIGTLRTGLALGYRVQTDSLISGLVGVAIDAIVMKAFAPHIDQLSAYHCDEVRRIVEDFLGAESPAIRLLIQEKSVALNLLTARRNDADGLLSLLKTIGTAQSPQHDDPDVGAVSAYLTNSPRDIGALVDDVRGRVASMYDQAIANARLPLAGRRPITKDTADTPAGALFRIVAVDADQIASKYSGDRARLRVLGVHVIIHRFRWDHDALPGSLSELRAPQMVRDAISGVEVTYARAGDLYTLAVKSPPSP